MARRWRRTRKRSKRPDGKPDAKKKGSAAPASRSIPDDMEPTSPDDPAFNREGRTWVTPAEQQRLEAARELMRKKQFLSAIEDLQPLIVMSPDLAEAQHDFAIARYFSGAGAAAIQAARLAAKLRPRWEMPRVLLGRLYLEDGQHENAVTSCRVAIDLGSKHPDLFLVLGQACKQLGRTDEARQAFEILTTLQPNSAEAHYQLGLALRQLAEKERAQEEFMRALRIDPGHAGARKIMKRARIDTGPLAERPTDAAEGL